MALNYVKLIKQTDITSHLDNWPQEQRFVFFDDATADGITTAVCAVRDGATRGLIASVWKRPPSGMACVPEIGEGEADKQKVLWS